MGVPVITRMGQHHASRVGASILTAVGCSELIADTDESFVEGVNCLAEDKVKIKQMRVTMRQQLQGSVLYNAKQFTAELESSYLDMWESWCSSN